MAKPNKKGPKGAGMEIDGMGPDAAFIGTGSHDLVVHGTGFGKDAQVIFGGTPLPTLFINKNFVKAPTGVLPGTTQHIPVKVRSHGHDSNELDFFVYDTTNAPPGGGTA